MTSAADDGAALLAGELRAAIARLSFHLRAAAAGEGLTPTRVAALVSLAKWGPQRSGDLACRLGVSAASMTRLAEILLERGWVVRRPDPADQRASLLEITGAGEGALEALRSAEASRLSETLRALGPAQREAIEAALPALLELADRHLERELGEH